MNTSIDELQNKYYMYRLRKNKVTCLLPTGDISSIAKCVSGV